MKRYLLLIFVVVFEIFGENTFEFYHDNDLFITDEDYTSGVEFKYKQELDEGGNYNGFSFGQKFYTPSNITENEAKDYDRPYAAWLYLGIEKEKIEQSKKVIKGIQLGLMGPNALGEFVQKGVHRAIGEEDPSGWKEQVEEMVGVQYYISEYKEKGKNSNLDGYSSWSIHKEMEVGNIFSNLKYGILMQMGNKSIYNDEKGDWKYYVYYEPQICIVLYDATIQGKIFSDDQDGIVKDSNLFVIKNTLGASLNYKNIVLEYSLNLNSTTVKDLPWKPLDHIYNKFYIKMRL